jgi:hypothetical protein
MKLKPIIGHYLTESSLNKPLCTSPSFKLQSIHGLFLFRILTSELMNLYRHFVGLGRRISPTQDPYLHRKTQHRKTPKHIHAPSEIRTRDPRFRAVEGSTCLRPRAHWDRHHSVPKTWNSFNLQIYPKYFCNSYLTKYKETIFDPWGGSIFICSNRFLSAMNEHKTPTR